jgi:hypothetical protein
MNEQSGAYPPSLARYVRYRTLPQLQCHLSESVLAHVPGGAVKIAVALDSMWVPEYSTASVR